MDNEMKTPYVDKQKKSFTKAFRIWTLVIAAAIIGITPFAVNAKGTLNGFSPVSEDAGWTKQAVNEAPSEEVVSSILLKEGVQDETLVPEVQQKLMDLGYMDNDEPTTEYNENTMEAVKMFERKHDIAPDGILTEYEYDLLMSDDAEEYSVSRGYEGVDVEQLQLRLKDLGYLSDVTGEYGLFTENAVKEFQSVNGLGTTGEIDTSTRELLYSENAVSKPVEKGDENEDIKQYQQILADLGYYAGEIDGMFGDSMVAAVKRFQEKHGIIATGTIGADTLEILLDESRRLPFTYSLGDSGAGVTEIQQRLIELGYMSEATGYYGEHTEIAVKRFQELNGLTADGKVGLGTLNKLNSSGAVAYQVVADEPEPEPSEEPTASTEPSETPSASTEPSESTSPNPSTSTNPNPSTSTSPSPSTSTAPAGNEATGSANSSKVEEFIAVAQTQMGKKYVLGGKGPDTYDCSGFVYWCLNQVGVSQSYMTSAGWKATTKYPIVTKIGDLQRGDIISYEGHVGIYLGNGQMIDASSAEGKVRITSIGGSYWQTNFIKGCRVF